MGEVGYVVPGNLSQDGLSVSFEIVDGVPTNYDKRVSRIAIANVDGEVGLVFDTSGKEWDSGQVVTAFEECDKPTPVGKGLLGILGIKNGLACTALKRVQR